MFLMAAAGNLLMAYLSLEFVSLTSYVLTGFLRPNRRSGDRRTGDRRSHTPLSRMLEGLGTTSEHAVVMPVEPALYPLTPSQTAVLVREALTEDEAFNDVTTIATVLSGRRERAHIVARANGVVAGLPLAVEAFRQIDPRLTVRVDVPDGAVVKNGMPVLFMSGSARGIFSA